MGKDGWAQGKRLGALILFEETGHVTCEWLLDRGFATTPKYVGGHVDLCWSTYLVFSLNFRSFTLSQVSYPNLKINPYPSAGKTGIQVIQRWGLLTSGLYSQQTNKSRRDPYYEIKDVQVVYSEMTFILRTCHGFPQGNSSNTENSCVWVSKFAAKKATYRVHIPYH